MVTGALGALVTLVVLPIELRRRRTADAADPGELARSTGPDLGPAATARHRPGGWRHARYGPSAMRGVGMRGSVDRESVPTVRSP